jgi:hypothetical protein
MDYTLYNTAEQVDRAISGAYEALVVAGTGLFRYVSPPTGSSASGAIGSASVSGVYFFTPTGTNQWGRITLSSW